MFDILFIFTVVEYPCSLPTCSEPQLQIVYNGCTTAEVSFFFFGGGGGYYGGSNESCSVASILILHSAKNRLFCCTGSGLWCF